MTVQKIQGKRIIQDKYCTDRFHVTATERKSIKQGINQGFKKFGTSRKMYEVVYEALDLGFLEVEISTKTTDDWGRAQIRKDIVEVILVEHTI